MSRVSRIDAVPGLLEIVAEAYANGATQEEIASLAGVSDRGTVAEWLKRTDVQVAVSKFIQDRANRITRHTDSAIEKKIEAKGEKMSLEQLLKIRQAFAAQQIKIDLTGDKADAMSELFRTFFEHPDLAAAFGELDAPQPGD